MPRKAESAQETVVELIRTAGAVRRVLAEAIDAFGVTGQQYNVLRILRGVYPEPLPTMDLAERMMEKTPGMTGLLDRLEKKGLVRRERSPDDRRVWYCTITPEGMALLEEMNEPVALANERAVQKLKADERAALAGLLRRVRGG